MNCKTTTIYLDNDDNYEIENAEINRLFKKVFTINKDRVITYKSLSK